ncbi:UDP-glucuronosyl/UDP-glucosyltransferase [Fibrisoma limi BUZ 3]|uniref:UDP-glucuronosyl/UDP-glucosyltransferase n=1 Tax=Fibrisoma limi BUZ 3 TaxID=1185876 RepID=I2GK31_9BACT|nr:glycosyltransferase [Fibrisoma limi]CCH54256.1 UDP-glucuronosyl/UDP-glucosyltransferase [Fibrisoma limi BUZ 3]
MNISLREQVAGKKILVATFSADGHFNPLTGLAKHLQEAGCDVRWYTSDIYKKRLEKLGIPHFPVLAHEDVNADSVDELYSERALLTDVGDKANFDMLIFGKLSTSYLQDLRQIQQIFPFELVIADSLFSAIPLIKTQLNVPVLAIGVIPLAEESKDTAPFGPGLYPPANEDERNAYALMWKHFNEVVFKESIDAYAAILSEHGITPGNSYLFDTLIKHADLYLQIGTPSFEYQRSDLGENVRFIGGLLPYSSDQLDRFWNDDRWRKYKRTVLVTQGTVERDTAKLIEPTLDAFQYSSDTLVIAATGGNNTEQLREKYPWDNIIIEDYIPFRVAMTYATVYVTNGGYSGTLLSIANQLPIVAAGLHEGKSEICARIGYFKIGINLNTETPTPQAIRDAVEQVIQDNTYRENIARLAQEMSDYNAKELCVQYALQVINEHSQQLSVH